MATLDVIYKIAADISGLQSGVERAAKATESLDSVAKTVTATLAGMFTVQAAIGFANQIADTADQLVKLSDKTGVTIEGLQRMRLAGDDAGNTLDELTRAITKMQDNLASGNGSAVSALRQLNLTVDDLKGIGPEKQFYAISDAIRQVADPATRAQIAIDLFGKSGADVLPTLMRGFNDVKDAAVGMSDDTARAIDESWDTLGRWKQQLLDSFATYSVTVVRFVESGFNYAKMKQNELVRDAEAVQAQLEQMVPKIARPAAFEPPKAPELSESTLRAFNRDMAEAARKQDEAAAAAKRHAAEMARLGERVREVNHLTSRPLVDPDYYDPADSSKAFLGQIDQIRRVLGEWDKVKPGTKGLESVGQSALTAAPLVSDFGKRFDGVALAAQNTAKEARGLSDAFASLVRLDFSHLSSDLGQLVNNFKAAAKDIARGFMEGLGQSLEQKAFKLIEAGFKKLWRVITHAEEREVNDMRDAFQATFGTFDDMAKAAAGAGYQIEKLLNTKKVEAFNKEMQALKDAIAFQDNAMRTLEETTKKYGFTIEELGPAFARQQLDKQAQELYQDFKVLTAAGIDTDTVLMRMGDSINEFVHNALKTGTEIPSAMAPMLQRMVEMGTLTDENGNVITDLEKSGVHFAMTMSEGFAKVVQAVEKLTDAITRGLGLAIANIPDPQVEGHVSWKVDQIPTGPVSSSYQDDWRTPDVAMADGGIVDRPTVALIGEAGPEAVVPLRDYSKGNVYNFAELKAEMMALREQQRVTQDYFQTQFSRDLARATRDERQKVVNR